MLDIQHLRDDITSVAEKLKLRGFDLNIQQFSEWETQRKSLQTLMQSLQNERNTHSKKIGLAKAKGGNVDPLLAEVGDLGERLEQAKNDFAQVSEQLEGFLLMLPNFPHESVPKGKSEEENVEVRRIGTPKQFSFTPLSHDELGEKLGLLDFETAAKITGSRFSVLKGGLARLHRALVSFMLDIHTQEHGYAERYVPYIVNRESLIGTSQLPKFEEDLFKLQGDSPYYLIPTGEIPLTNQVRDCLLESTDLPLRYTAHTPCFRSEAGSYGKDTKGMIRQHQFEKVELVWVTRPEDSYEALETLVKHAEIILQKLELPYRVVSLCTGDIGFHSAKTYDLEVWLPAQNTYREISSCTNCEAFQARRMKTRWKNPSTGKNEWVHTLNGSGLAVGRTLVAIMENYQDEQGNIHIPKALQPYMMAQEVLEADYRAGA
jgi:seryl-tRNA synthetase